MGPNSGKGPGWIRWPPEGILRLASRGSPLARRQTSMVASLLEKAAPGLRSVIVVVETRGDRLSEEPLEAIGGQGAFVKEVQNVVLEGGADVAVHSAKDLPSGPTEGLLLAAVPERADPRDALVGSRLDDLKPGSLVATGSARRRAQLANARPDLMFTNLRGNIETRLNRVKPGEVAAVVVASVALGRLGLNGRASEVLSPTVMLPQVGQGALALECRADDVAVSELLALIDDPTSHEALSAERSMLSAMGASCALPVGGWARRLGGGELCLDGLMASPDGRILLRTSMTGTVDAGGPEALGRKMANYLVNEAGGSQIEGWGSST